MKQLPEKFLERLKHIIPGEHLEKALHAFQAKRPAVFRINTLKTTANAVLGQLQSSGARVIPVPWLKQAVVIPDHEQETVQAFVAEGYLYQQGLSSMLVPVVLDPQHDECVLDLCAAPGSKSSQMAAMMRNTGVLQCNEPIRKRFYKLKSVLSLTGVTNARLSTVDGRKFKSDELFDRVLIDAPCSSEGRFSLLKPKSFQYWSERKIKEMVQKQRGIVLNGWRLLKPGGTLVYATCTFAPEENEGVIDWLMRKADGPLTIIPISLNHVDQYAAITAWRDRAYNPDVKQCCRILPTEEMDAFFIAKLVKA